jgi:peroxiredoxin
VRSDDLYDLPAGLPDPVDDGACAHLIGREIPAIGLPSTGARTVDLRQIASPWLVVYAYPRTGLPDVSTPPGWDAIPGARGCTPQSCAYRDHYRELAAEGAEVFGLSTQDTEYQREMAIRLRLPFEVLSDAELGLTRSLNLPTFRFGEWTLLKRHTLIIRRARIEQVFYPVFPPDADAERVLRWLRTQREIPA